MLCTHSTLSTDPLEYLPHNSMLCVQQYCTPVHCILSTVGPGVFTPSYVHSTISTVLLRILTLRPNVMYTAPWVLWPGVFTWSHNVTYTAPWVNYSSYLPHHHMLSTQHPEYYSQGVFTPSSHVMNKAPLVLFPRGIYPITPRYEHSMLSTVPRRYLPHHPVLWTEHSEVLWPWGIYHISPSYVHNTLSTVPPFVINPITSCYIHNHLSTISLRYLPYHPMLCTQQAECCTLGYLPHHPMLWTQHAENCTKGVLIPSSHVMYAAPWVWYP